MKTLTFSLVAVVLTQVSSLALDLGVQSRSTPYDRYMNPVKQVLSKVHGEETDMRRARDLMRIGRSFRYSFTTPYTASLPQVTAARRAGDCKDKALWLINELNDDSVRFVIGKARANSTISHAWVLWKCNGRWWILDPTNRRDPIAADHVSNRSYIPEYSYSKNGVFHHGVGSGDTEYASAKGERFDAIASVDGIPVRRAIPVVASRNR